VIEFVRVSLVLNLLERLVVDTAVQQHAEIYANVVAVMPFLPARARCRPDGGPG
jgi:hypothetical protein